MSETVDPLEDLLTPEPPVKHTKIDLAFYEAVINKAAASGTAMSYPIDAKTNDAKKEEQNLRSTANALGHGLKVQMMDNGRIKFQVTTKRKFDQSPEAVAERKARREANKAKKEAEKKAAAEKAAADRSAGEEALKHDITLTPEFQNEQSAKRRVRLGR